MGAGSGRISFYLKLPKDTPWRIALAMDNNVDLQWLEVNRTQDLGRKGRMSQHRLPVLSCWREH